MAASVAFFLIGALIMYSSGSGAIGPSVADPHIEAMHVSDVRAPPRSLG